MKKIKDRKSMRVGNCPGNTGLILFAMLIASISLGPRAARADETCMSPYMAKITGQEDYMYVWTLGMEGVGDGSDKLVSDIETTPDEIDFGSLTDSQTLVEPVVLRNITSTPITVSKIYIDASEQAGYSLKTECSKLEPGQGYFRAELHLGGDF